MLVWEYIGAIGGGFVIIVGVFARSWFKIQNQTNVLLKEQNVELREANKDLQCKNDTYLQQLSSLAGQVDMLKSIPLVNIDLTLKKLTDFNATLSASIDHMNRINTKILDRLNNDALILAHDSTAVAAAVHQVKTDLEHVK